MINSTFTKYALTGALVLTLLAPIAYAEQNSPNVTELLKKIELMQRQITELQKQLQATKNNTNTTGIKQIPDHIATSTKACLRLTRTLNMGTTDATANGEVSELQRFLKDEGHFANPQITGYFGPQTEEAVKKYQLQKGIVSLQDSDLRGYGSVGPRTRSFAQMDGCKKMMEGNMQMPPKPAGFPKEGNMPMMQRVSPPKSPPFFPGTGATGTPSTNYVTPPPVPEDTTPETTSSESTKEQMLASLLASTEQLLSLVTSLFGQ